MTYVCGGGIILRSKDQLVSVFYTIRFDDTDMWLYLKSDRYNAFWGWVESDMITTKQNMFSQQQQKNRSYYKKYIKI